MICSATILRTIQNAIAFFLNFCYIQNVLDIIEQTRAYIKALLGKHHRFKGNIT
jgi:hypothetical protein